MGLVAASYALVCVLASVGWMAKLRTITRGSSQRTVIAVLMGLAWPLSVVGIVLSFVMIRRHVGATRRRTAALHTALEAANPKLDAGAMHGTVAVVDDLATRAPAESVAPVSGGG